MAAAGRPGMDDEGVRDFVSRYLPAYSAYLPELYRAAAAEGVGGKPTLLARNPTHRFRSFVSVLRSVPQAVGSSLARTWKVHPMA